MVDQIYYNNWNDKLAPGDENYWWMISTIASWIGYALEGSIHGWQTDPYFISTISVRQVKEKFGEVRIYCSFAHPPAVQQFYDKAVARINDANRRYDEWKSGRLMPGMKNYPSKYMIKVYNEAYPRQTPTLDEFTTTRMFEDAKWYRQVYNEAMKLWPQYAKALSIAADFCELLHQTPGSFDAYYARRVADIKKYTSDTKSLATGLASLEKEQDFSRRVSGFDTETINE